MIVLMLTAALVTAGLCLALIPLARKVNMVDQPGRRKVHQEPTPLTGGPALFITSGLMMLFLYEGDLFVQGLAMGGVLMFIMGMIDDYRTLPASVRFLAQIVACMIIIVYADVKLDDFGQLLWDRQLGLGWLSVPVTVFAAMGVINSFNMIDGMDGLAGSVFLVAAVGMALVAGLSLQFKLSVLLLVALSAVSGFLLLNARFPWNKKARVFMGDSGSTLLGFFLAWSFISLGSDHNEAGQRAFMPMTAVWLFAVPLLDTSTVMWSRLTAGKSPFTADQHHLHHAFLRAGFTVGQALWAISALAITCAAIGMAFEFTKSPQYWSFWSFMVVAFSFRYTVKQTWLLQRFLGRDFIYNEPDN